MANKAHKRQGFVSTGCIELLLLVLAICAIAELIFGNWLSRTVVVLVPLTFAVWAYWYDYRYMRFRIGDCVLLTDGPHNGKTGTVVESEFAPYGARIKIDGEEDLFVDCPMGRNIRKL